MGRAQVATGLQGCTPTVGSAIGSRYRLSQCVKKHKTCLERGTQVWVILARPAFYIGIPRSSCEQDDGGFATTQKYDFQFSVARLARSSVASIKSGLGVPASVRDLRLRAPRRAPYIGRLRIVFRFVFAWFFSFFCGFFAVLCSAFSPLGPPVNDLNGIEPLYKTIQVRWFVDQFSFWF